MSTLKKGLAALLAVSVIGCTTPNPVSIATANTLINHERNQADLEIKSIKLASGYTMVYAESSNKSAEPLLLVHGFGGNKDNFTLIAQEFKDYHVIIPDLIGFGESDKPMEEDYRARAQAERLHELMEAKGLASSVHIAGNSMGGSISTAYAAMYPKEVKSLWLIDAGGFFSVGLTEALQGATLENNPLLIKSYEDFERLTGFLMYDPPYVPSSLKAVLAQERIDNQQLEAKVLQQIATDSVEDEAKVIAANKIPTLVLWGDKDKVIKPETAAYIAELIPQAKVVMLEDSGHIPMIETVEPTAKAYNDFRQELKQQQQQDVSQ